MNLEDLDYQQLKAFLPTASKRGRPRVSEKRKLEGILHKHLTNTYWRDLEGYGFWASVQALDSTLTSNSGYQKMKEAIDKKELSLSDSCLEWLSLFFNKKGLC